MTAIMRELEVTPSGDSINGRVFVKEEDFIYLAQ